MDNHGIEKPTNDWDKYQALQCRLMAQWRAEEHNARMEVLVFEEGEVTNAERDSEGSPEATA